MEISLLKVVFLYMYFPVIQLSAAFSLMCYYYSVFNIIESDWPSPRRGHDVLSEEKRLTLNSKQCSQIIKSIQQTQTMESMGKLQKSWLYLEAQDEKQQEGVVKCLEINCTYLREMRRGRYKVYKYIKYVRRIISQKFFTKKLVKTRTREKKSKTLSWKGNKLCRAILLSSIWTDTRKMLK